MGLLHRQGRILDPPDLALLAGRRPDVRADPRGLSPYEYSVAYSQHDFTFYRPAKNDRLFFEKRLCGCSVRGSSHACGVRRLDYGTQGRAFRLLLDAVGLGLYWVCEQARLENLCSDSAVLHAGPYGQTHDCHFALCFSAAGLLAPGKNQV